MGSFRMGPPEDLVKILRDDLNIKTFIETGTFKGGTAEWASMNFTNVITIEFDEDIYKETSIKLKEKLNINFRYGDSRKELQKIIQDISEQAIFWLDAHWCSFGSYGEYDQCPLLNELEVLNNSNYNHIILIDDARLFLLPPPRPNSAKYYPSIKEIISILTIKYDRYVFVFEDVIIAIPQDYKLIVDFLQDKTTDEWEKRKIQLKENGNLSFLHKLKQTKELISKILFIWKP